MEIRIFAEKVLFSSSLEDKLADPGTHLTDDHPGVPGPTPEFPHRPPELVLHPRSPRIKPDFPGLHQLDQKGQRGKVLHFFANHELLALELMALCLIKFPNGPIRFRRGLVQTMREEQVHVRLYLNRMAECGIDFGSIPVNAFFWHCSSQMKSPLDYVAQISLTFEQANLDFSRYYHRAFDEVGDEDTARLMERVYRDEIKHVRYGHHWFQKWTDPDQSLWQAFDGHLDYPLNPSRAKGPVFNREGREKAGLPREFIDRLYVFSHSKGKSPLVYLFNPACEIHLARGKEVDVPQVIDDLQRDFASLFTFVAGGDDVVLVPEIPGVEFRVDLCRAGFDLAQFVRYEKGRFEGEGGFPLKERNLAGLRPWGWSPDSRNLLAPMRERVRSGRLEDRPTDKWWDKIRSLYTKEWDLPVARTFLQDHSHFADWLIPTEAVGKSCRTTEEIKGQLSRLDGLDYPHGVVKANWEAAGRHIYRCKTGKITSKDEKIWRRILQQQEVVVVEPWLEKVLDFSFQFHRRDEGHLSHLGTYPFLTSPHGRYRGAVLGRMLSILPGELRDAFFGYEKSKDRLKELEKSLGHHLNSCLEEVGYRGPVGVDGFLYRDRRGDKIKMKPVVEVNPRYTMGRLAHHLHRHVHPSRVAFWLHYNQREIKGVGRNFIEVAERIRLAAPVEVKRGNIDRVERGVVFTNDPHQARRFISLLVVGRNGEDCRRQLTGLPLELETLELAESENIKKEL